MTSITSINQIPSNYHCHRRIYKLVWGDKTKLYGEVEVDESYFGKQKYGKQRLVIGAIERHTKQIRLQLIYDRSRISCERFVQRSVCSGSLVATDGLDSYNELRYLGYDWTSCNHNVGIFGPIPVKLFCATFPHRSALQISAPASPYFPSSQSATSTTRTPSCTYSG